MSAHAALLIDFGSTYTKLRAVDLDAARLIGTGQGPSTVRTDVRIGMRAALSDLEAHLGTLPRFRYRLASSSAAGGLRMVTIGLVRELTVEAARQAALGAGAKLVGTFVNKLTRGDIGAIEALAPDIVLLAGGTDGGNTEVILHNASMLANSAIDAPIVYAGNRVAADDAREILAKKSVTVAGNVMPELGILGTDSAREAIRNIFIARIVHAKGIDRAQEMFDDVMMPTPAAVMEGARLLADGVGRNSGLGELLVVDPGGATTDVHSIASGESKTGAIPKGLPEPRVKRTVEGDLGMRHSAASVVETAGAERIAEQAHMSVGDVAAMLARIAGNVEMIPQTPREHAFDRALLATAIEIAVRRHAGTIETVYTALGPATIQRGKDLSGIQIVVATGGAPTHLGEHDALLEAMRAAPSDPHSLRPRAPRLYVDRDYMLFGVGLLASVEPQAAFAVARHSVIPADRVEEVAQ
ncbi:MAG TPA: methylaspartate mutase accessory protein GlmL [Candidatus Acidoferrales bacterium]|nr:methylaspartate mutase accessory protein GlmL [Candidatus Acidoferrales bacterium]